jgi:hypothetical protein
MPKFKLKVLPIMISAVIGLLVSHTYFHSSILVAVAIAIPLELILFCVRWERNDGTHLFGRWW